MMVAKVLGLAGYAGSGKDEVSDFVVKRFGYRKMSIATPIREEFEEFLERALREASHIYGLPEHFECVIEAYRKAVWNKPTSPEVRVGLQWWGTDYKRQDDPFVWTKNLKPRLTTGELIVFSDIRDPVEIDLVREVGGEVWWVDRPGVQPVGLTGHKTETAIGPGDCDRIVKNDSSLETLFDKIDFIFRFC